MEEQAIKPHTEEKLYKIGYDDGFHEGYNKALERIPHLLSAATRPIHVHFETPEHAHDFLELFKNKLEEEGGEDK